MEHFFSELRNKPYRYRRNVALGFAVAVTVIIFSIWAVSTRARFEARLDDMAKKGSTTTPGDPRGATAELTSPFEAISQTVDEGLDTIKLQFEELSKLAE